MFKMSCRHREQGI